MCQLNMITKSEEVPNQQIGEAKTMLLRMKQNRSLRLDEITGKVYMSAETIS